MSEICFESVRNKNIMPFRQKKVSKAVHKIKRQGLVREHKFWRQKSVSDKFKRSWAQELFAKVKTQWAFLRSNCGLKKSWRGCTTTKVYFALLKERGLWSCFLACSLLLRSSIPQPSGQPNSFSLLIESSPAKSLFLFTPGSLVCTASYLFSILFCVDGNLPLWTLFWACSIDSESCSQQAWMPGSHMLLYFVSWLYQHNS